MSHAPMVNTAWLRLRADILRAHPRPDGADVPADVIDEVADELDRLRAVVREKAA